MFLKKLGLFQFKSYQERIFGFEKSVNLILGKNGSGKTNILEAIYFSCISKSFSGLTDHQLIKDGESYFMASLEIDAHKLIASAQVNQKKVFTLNKIPYSKIADHIGAFPVVFVSPNDHDYIRDASDTRRKLFDELFCQLDKPYLVHLMAYNKLLKQRNATLKQFKERNYFDTTLLEIYDLGMEAHQAYIRNFRASLIEEINTFCQSFYLLIANHSESISIAPLFQELTNYNYLERMKANEAIDRASARTNFGCHKDDFDFLIDGKSLKKFGSQGQQKSFMLAIQFTKHQLLMKYLGKTPFLLLDDVFDKLDQERIKSLLKLVSRDNFGQVFITDANPARALNFCKESKIDICAIYTDELEEVKV
jgi:DNA replication and repair protein RecF